MKKCLSQCALLTWFVIHLNIAQVPTGDQLLNAISSRESLRENSLLKKLKARSIGPVVQGGRIIDIAVHPENNFIYYVGYASGGIFKTKNNGVSFEPVFDNQGSLTIGDMALSNTDPNVLYVGTGEKNSSRSSYAGNGIYKSLDAGNSWVHVGLENTHHIGRIVVHPENPDLVLVAAMGALYSKNSERGVYRSADGGKTWNKTLFINDSTGIIDLAMNESNPNELIACSWERSRKAWDFKGNGINTAIYRSGDGGMTWKKSMAGINETKFNGRIGVNYAQGNSNVVYAVMDNQFESKEEKEVEEGIQVKDFLTMNESALLNLDDDEFNKFLKDKNFPEKYSSEKVKNLVNSGSIKPLDIAEYFGDANEALFDTKITGAEVYRSDDGGRNWKKVNTYWLEGVYFTYGYYFSEITVSPQNEDELYIYGVPLLKSLDGGKTFSRIDTMGNVHVDHHALWINPNNDDHVILGNDGGLYISYDGGAEWMHINNDAVGQFYTVNVDMEKPYNVYGGTQDNGTLRGSSQTIPGKSSHWERIYGGDGMFVAADPRNSDVIYSGFQFGNYFRLNKNANKSTRITPKHDIGDPKLRFNWRTPIIISSHHPDILYIGSQKLHRSLNQGESWDEISVDLTHNRTQGNVPFSTITCIAESPHKFGVIYVGTDDGNVQLTKDGGGQWTLISGDLPEGKWVNNIFISPHSESTVFVSLTGYREDDFYSYVFESNDFGQTWHDIKGNLPMESVNVVIQDPVSANLLYLGTDYATYASLDHGKNWQMISQIPNVASYDMMVHPRDNELVVATHGRSMYVVDVKPLQKLKDNGNDIPVVAFEMANLRFSKYWGKRRYPYLEPVEPSLKINYFVFKPVKAIQVEILNEDKQVINKFPVPGDKGYQSFSWDTKIQNTSKKGKDASEGSYLSKGKYLVRLIHPEGTDEKEFEVK